MAIHFFTDDAPGLLKSFDARIAQKEQKGKITTWEKDSDGDYTHKAPEWHQKAWLKPKIKSDRLTFNVIKPKDKNVSAMTYAYYHGHLIETFLNHFDKSFSQATATSLAAADDNC